MTTNVWLLTAVLASVVSASPATSAPAADARTEDECRATDLTLRVEHGDGRFTGMSHDGAIVVVRNVGARRCTMPALPELVMLDAGGAVVARARPPQARGMHPGPYVPPIVLEPGAIAASTLRWLAGNALGEPARSVRASAVALPIGGGRVEAPLSATVWTRGTEPSVFGMERLQTALPPLGPPTSPSPGTFVGVGAAGATYVDAAGAPARTLVIRPRSAGSLAFRFDGIAGAAPNLGSISGILLVHGERAEFRDPRRDCALVVSFYAEQLTVRQSGACGFGNGVTTQGQYRRRY